MNAETIFSIANYTAMIGWLLMIFLPRWIGTRKLVMAGIIPILLAGLYLFLIVAHFGEAEGSFGSLEEVGLLFQNPYALLAGWVHYLAFDLFVGSWELADAQENGIPHFLLIPCLLLTFFLGPIGWLLYMGIRAIKTKRYLNDNFSVSS